MHGINNLPGRKPDFFIVGAPRCGTTAMTKYLAAHPDVYMPERKEMHVFGSDLRFGPHFWRRNEQDYLAEYTARNGEVVAGESSVWYLFSSRAAAEIKAFSPEARIIVMLREPVEMLYSLYHHFRLDGNECLPTFEEALAAEPDRRAGKRIGAETYLAQGLQYREIVRFTEQVSRYFEVFGRERVHIVIYDDLAGDTLGIYRETLGFLGLDSWRGPANLTAINGSRYPRSAALRRLLNGKHVRQTALMLRPLLPRPAFGVLRGLQEKLLLANSRPGKRSPLSPALRARLKREFAPEIERLSELLGRDLTFWSEQEKEPRTKHQAPEKLQFSSTNGDW
jgi:hypothetical protein